MDVIDLHKGMMVGEAGAGYGYFTFKMRKRVGATGIVYSNDIDPAALRLIDAKCQSEKITNIKTVLGAEDDPLYPKNNLDMVVVFDWSLLILILQKSEIPSISCQEERYMVLPMSRAMQ